MHLLMLLACMHKVRIQSEPPGAVVRVNGERIGVTPVDFKVPLIPHLRSDACFGFTGEGDLSCDNTPYRVQVKLPGYRTSVLTVGDEARWWRSLNPLARVACLRVAPWKWVSSECADPETIRTIILVEEHGPSGTWTPEEVR